MYFARLLVGLATASVASAAAVKRAGKMQFVGVNESGPEFGEKSLPGIPDKDYVWPTSSTIDVRNSEL